MPAVAVFRAEEVGTVLACIPFLTVFEIECCIETMIQTLDDIAGDADLEEEEDFSSDDLGEAEE